MHLKGAHMPEMAFYRKKKDGRVLHHSESLEPDKLTEPQIVTAEARHRQKTVRVTQEAVKEEEEEPESVAVEGSTPVAQQYHH